ncbi:MAG TPA: N-acetyltransferase [Planctomycetota bacterium]|nr:N-acetyltransferase [Planctomycetota bacterium]
MSLTIRQETPVDYAAVEALIREAFTGAPHASGKEWLLVQRLRGRPDFIGELSLVAEQDRACAGHVLFTPIAIVAANGGEHTSIALAPVSVLPRFQRCGIGSQLIRAGHEAAKRLGFTSSIVLGDPAYYSRCGYGKASQWQIRAPFDVPDDAFMALELSPGALSSVSGTVRYPPEFDGV